MTRMVLESVTYSFSGGSMPALREVTVDIPSGQFVGIVGANGSGKTTLIRHLNGLNRPSSGRVLLDGRDVRQTSVGQLARAVGWAGQEPEDQIFNRSVAAEVAWGLRRLGFSAPRLRRAVDESLSAMGLLEKANSNPYDMSRSDRRRLTIACALAPETAVIVLDEPTRGLDESGVQAVEAALRHEKARGATVVLVSHSLSFIARICERVIVLREGRVLLDAPTAQVFSPAGWPYLAAAHLVPPLAARVSVALGLQGITTEDSLVRALSERRTARQSGSQDQGV